MAESVFGKPIDNAVKEINEQISESNSNFTAFQMRYLNQSTDDLNNLYNTSDSGLYITGGSTLNSPVAYCPMLVIARNGTCGQILFGDYIYGRNRSGSPPAWSAWRRVKLETF